MFCSIFLHVSPLFHHCPSQKSDLPCLSYFNAWLRKIGSVSKVMVGSWEVIHPKTDSSIKKWTFATLTQVKKQNIASTLEAALYILPGITPPPKANHFLSFLYRFYYLSLNPYVVWFHVFFFLKFELSKLAIPIYILTNRYIFICSHTDIACVFHFNHYCGCATVPQDFNLHFPGDGSWASLICLLVI